jgi:hypothetical protein
VSSEVKAYLGRLPFRVDLLPRGGHHAGPWVVLVHGTPTLTVYWTEDRPDAFCLKMAGHAGLKPGDVLAFGHTHIPWHREIGGIHFVNTGSAGRPKDGDWRAGYVILEVGHNRSPSVEFIRVEYDLARAQRDSRKRSARRVRRLPADWRAGPRWGSAGSSIATSTPLRPLC